MPSPIHKPFVSKIFPVTPLNSKFLALLCRYRSDSKRSGGRGGYLFLPRIITSLRTRQNQ